NDKTNHNLMEANASSELEIQNITIQNAGGTLNANGGTVTLNGATIRGGTLNDTGSGTVEGIGTSTLEDVTNAGLLRVFGGNTLRFTGAALTNSGTIQINYTGASATTTVSVLDSVVLQGAGDLRLMSPGGNASINTLPGAVLTQAAGHL